jgi:integrase
MSSIDAWRRIRLPCYASEKRAKNVPKIAFTDIAIRGLKPGEYFDAKTPSFGIRVGKNRKTWIVMRGSKDRVRIRVGHYPALSLSEARKKAFISLGGPHAQQQRPSFKWALDAFIEIHVPTLKPRTQREIKRTLTRHFLPKLSGKKLAEITHSDIATVTDKLLDTPSEAWHAFKDARTFFNWCVPRYIPHSPCQGLKSPTRYVPRKRVLSYDEIKAIWTALGAVEYPFAQIVRLLTLTGCRHGEIVSLRWPFINEKERTITLPETKNKDETAYNHRWQCAARKCARFSPHRFQSDGADFRSWHESDLPDVWYWAAFGGQKDTQRIALKELRRKTPALSSQVGGHEAASRVPSNTPS